MPFAHQIVICLLQLVPRGLPSILAHLESLRVFHFPSLLLTVEFHQGITVIVGMSGIAFSEIPANLVAAPLLPGFIFRIEPSVAVGASFVDL